VVITCPSCNERYRLSDDKIKGKGAKITCPSCKHLFVVFAEDLDGKSKKADADITTGAFRAVGMDEADNSPATTGSIRVVAPGPRGSKKRGKVTTVNTSSNAIPTLKEPSEHSGEEAPASVLDSETVSEDEDLKASDLDFREVGIVTWKVKVSIGLVYDFSDIMTLKKYLDDQKVTPEDLISHNAKDWVKIGEVGDLDEHFVRTWKAARNELKDGSKTGKKSSKKTPKAVTSEDSETSEVMAAAARDVDAGRTNFGPAMEDPFAKARSQRKAGKGRRPAKAAVQEKSSLPMGAIAALLAVGAVAVGFVLIQPKDSEPMVNSAGSPATTDAASDATDATNPDIEAHRDAVRTKIREQMQRRQEEIQAGMNEEGGGIDEDDQQDPLDEAMRKARRVAVRPSEQTVQPSQVDSKGFRKPLARAKAAAEPKGPLPPPRTNTGSAQMTEHKTRDPGRLYYDNGRRLMERKNYGSALKMFQTSVDKSPQCGSCWEGLASAYQVLGEAQKAAEAFKKAEQLGVPVNAARP
jgi:predicted Zn finger-like uncharacterized protein